MFEDLPDVELVIKRLAQRHIHYTNLPLSSNKGLSLDYVRRFPRDSKNPAARTQFVTFSSLTTAKTIELFEQIVLTPEEDFVTEALQTIEPSIERIATVGYEKYQATAPRSGFVVRPEGN